jgi:hypothetical protein
MANKKVKIKSGNINLARLKGDLVIEPLTITGSTGTITDRSFVILNGDDNTVTATIAAPTQGLLLVLTCPNADNLVKCKLTAGTYDGTNNTATFPASSTLVVFGVSSTRFVIVENINTVTFSST